MAIFKRMARKVTHGTMNFMRASLGAGLLACCVFCPSLARADFVLHHWEDHYEPFRQASLEGDLNFYSTNENYDPNGNATPLPRSNTYKRDGLDVLGEFGLFEQVSFFARLSYATISDTFNSSTTNGPTDQTVGADFRVLKQLDLQFQIDLPAYSNSNNDAANSPYQGDGSVDITFGGFATLPLSDTPTRLLSVTGGLGYTYRTGHYSAAVPWNLSANYNPKISGVFVSGSFLGLTSLKTDSSILIAKTNGFLTGSGGSFITDEINPSLVVGRGRAGYQFDGGSQLFASVEGSVWGQDVPLGMNYSVGLKLAFGAASDESKPYEKSNRGLTQYTLEAKVVRSNDRLNLVKIDKGSDDGVVKGQIYDIFSVTPDGSEKEAVARCQVKSVKSDEAALAIIEYFKEVWIDEGFIAKRLIQ
jgi:hypothetical protein